MGPNRYSTDRARSSHDGTSVVGLPIPTNDAIYATAAAGDLTGDGTMEVAFASYDGSVNVLDLLLARCPTSDVIRDMAAEYGVKKTSFVETDTDSTCIMCTLCIRACEAVGAKAMSTVRVSAGPRASS